ncbi:Cell division control protein 18 [Sphaceloma murrayae]|uniref:Cell division control protein n=1 Tax=Sphaceloma murrayae TaxID=2082308 RepID=A0A2K1QRK5_9PEZI|nr:Cell division control protein 18 [Sphaceloma murrayae]
MSTVLGKRTRSPSITTYGTRSKRVSRDIEVHRDEQCTDADIATPPTISRSAVKSLDALEISTPSKSRLLCRPSKHVRNDSRKPQAAPAIDAHFAVSKRCTNAVNKKKTTVTPPVTPRHRRAVTTDPISPQTKVLVPGSVITPRTPATPTTTTKASPYSQARQLFTGCSEQGLLIGRQQERQQVEDFVSGRVDAGTGGCLYVSGPPGTGKSAFVGDIVQGLGLQASTICATVNCMSTKSASELMTGVAAAFNIEIKSKRHITVESLKAYFSTKREGGKMYLLVLDEVDRLVDLDLELLYSLFEWSMHPTSSLILIGIANALDLTDRLLPRLKSRNIKPSLLPFMPYTAAQISDIISTKLKTLSTDPNSTQTPFVQQAAILLCSKKVASQTGDLRKAFDIIKRALTLAENEARTSHSSAQISPSRSPLKTALSENVNLSSPPITTPIQTKLTVLCHLTPETAPKATIAHVAKVTSQIFSNGMSSRLSQLNIQQKAVLCTLAVFEKKARSSLSASLSAMTAFVPVTPSKTGRGQKVESPSTKQLYDAYSELCKKENLLHALSSVEFRDVLSGLETLSLVEFVDANGKAGTLGLVTPTKTPSRKSKKNDFGQMSLGTVMGDARRVSSVVGFKELNDSLVGAGSEILKEILEG